MNRERAIHDVYRIAGLLEGLSCMQGQTMTEAVAYMLADCVDKLEILGAELLTEDVKHDEGTEEAAGP